MPNIINANGIQIKTQAELIEEFSEAYRDIYGADINLEPDTPDAQMMMIYIQSQLDALEFMKEVYSTMSPDNAIGATLDQRVAFNGLQRQAGTYTITNITIVVSESINLYGLDQSTQEVYTVSDNAGNEWQLISSQLGLSSGTHVVAFRSSVPGAVLTIPNTINIPVTIVLGVVSVNNPSTYTTLGLNEESDAVLKLRRQRSVSLASQGYLAGLIAALKNISGVSDAFVYENRTGSTDSDDIPSHSIWVIIAGTADEEEIANAIYRKRNAGVGMKGDETYEITQVDGSPFIVKWDYVITEDVFIMAELSPLDGITPLSYSGIKDAIVENFIPGVNEKLSYTALISVINDFDNNAYVENSGFDLSPGSGPYEKTLTPSTKQNQFVIDPDKIILLPILPSPASLTIAREDEIQFEAEGGYGTYVWSIEVDNSGSSINSGTGVYTAGSSAGVDTVRVTDAFGNYTDITVTVP